MKDYRYKLEPYKGMNTRYRCPNQQCNRKTFVRYIDTETGKHIDCNVGRCNRESNCGYHYTPKQYFQDNNILFESQTTKKHTMPKSVVLKPVSFIPVELFNQSLKRYQVNNLIKFLTNLFGKEITNRLIEIYYIGTSKYWQGATVFWQRDMEGKIRAGKIMLYDSITGKRVKVPFNHFNWAHTALKLPEFNLQQCFFGEHLLQVETNKPVAIVESEKTAIIASVYLPDFIWLATGSLTNLTADKCKILKGRNVILYPDLNGFVKWNSKANDLSHITRFTVSGLLQTKATEAEKKDGLDLADYLIKFNYKDF